MSFPQTGFRSDLSLSQILKDRRSGYLNGTTVRRVWLDERVLCCSVYGHPNPHRLTRCDSWFTGPLQIRTKTVLFNDPMRAQGDVWLNTKLCFRTRFETRFRRRMKWGTYVSRPVRWDYTSRRSDFTTLIILLVVYFVTFSGRYSTRKTRKTRSFLRKDLSLGTIKREMFNGRRYNDDSGTRYGTTTRDWSVEIIKNIV